MIAVKKHTAFQKKGSEFTLDVQFIVVGSGAGGAAAALELAKAGKSVALVETGAWRDVTDYPKSILGTMRNLVNRGGTVTCGDAKWPVVQGVHLGGTTVINSAIRVNTPPDIFKQWQDNFGIGGKEMAEDMAKIQAELDVALSVQETPSSSLGKQDKLFYKTTKEILNYRETHYLKRYLLGCDGLNHCYRGCPIGVKRSMDTSFIEDFIAMNNCFVISCAKVSAITLQGKTATGVKGQFIHPITHQKGGTFHITASKGVMIAASATGSPLLLKKSGIKNKNLGHGFQAHPGSVVFGLYPSAINLLKGPTQGWGSVEYRKKLGFKLETLATPMDMLSGRIPGAGFSLMKRMQQWSHIASIAQACRAEAVGKVSSIFGYMRIKYTLNKEDMERFRLGIYEAARIHQAAGAISVMPGIAGLPDEIPASDIELIKQATLRPSAYQAVLSHLFGGCVMGTDASNSVCNQDGQVHDYLGLYVVDASVLPSNIGVNPQQTIMANAIRIVRRLIKNDAMQRT